MEFAPGQLAALLAIAEHGTFEAAARSLHVTPSAVSQRIRALESASGRVLVRRGSPCLPTTAGRALLRLARQVRLLEDEIRAELTEDAASRLDLPVAVNADSLATWFRGVVSEVATWEGAVLRLHVEDQAWSADLLRAGDVLGAVTSDPSPIQGCSVTGLGALRYVPAAAPELAERWRRGRAPDLARMPAVVFNEKDTLQDDLARARGQVVSSQVHRVPTSADFLEALRLGLGWGAVPEPQLAPELASGRLVRLGARWHVDVDLYWQCWRLDSPALSRLTAAVRRAAAGLRRG